MRSLTFAEPTPTWDQPRRLWVLLWQALNNPQWSVGGDRQVLRRVMKLLAAFDAVTVTTPQADGGLRSEMTPGTVSLEDAEYDLLKSAWAAYSPHLPAALARDTLAVDQFLEEASAPAEVAA